MKQNTMKCITRYQKNKIFFILLILLIISCFDCNAQNKHMVLVNDSILAEILIGNKDIYNKLSTNIYGINLLPYSIIMASSFNYGLACYDVYKIIFDMRDENNLPIDSILSETAIKYLIKGADLNDWNCCVELSYLYKKGLIVEQNDSKSILYIEKAQKALKK